MSSLVLKSEQVPEVGLDVVEVQVASLGPGLLEVVDPEVEVPLGLLASACRRPESCIVVGGTR